MNFEIKGVKYQSGKMDAMVAFHVTRRLAPVVPSFKSIFATAGDGETRDILTALEPLADAIAKMSDADTEYILGACMKVTSREQPGGGWAPVWGPTSNRPLYEDIDMLVMLQIAMHVLQETLGPFSSGLQPT